MIIRPANIGDMERCERLNSSYTTEYVWQMEESAPPGPMGALFRRMRAPRRMEVSYPRGTQQLENDCRSGCGCLLVADELGVLQGFSNLNVQRWQWQGWIEHLVVDRAYRRRGVASQLLTATERWARGSELRGIVAAVQAKNDPAITLLMARGYGYAGYIDRYFDNGDLALLFRLAL